MCKGFIQSLLGGGGTPRTPARVDLNDKVAKEGGAAVMNTDVVNAVAGREGSGRVKLGKASRTGSGAAVGLSI
mgnify:CR=1 FL=1